MLSAAATWIEALGALGALGSEGEGGHRRRSGCSVCFTELPEEQIAEETQCGSGFSVVKLVSVFGLR